MKVEDKDGRDKRKRGGGFKVVVRDKDGKDKRNE